MNRSISQTRNNEGFQQHDRHDGSLLPLMNMTSYGHQSIHEYERTPRFPQTATTIGFYDDIFVKNQLPSKVRPGISHLWCMFDRITYVFSSWS